MKPIFIVMILSLAGQTAFAKTPSSQKRAFAWDSWQSTQKWQNERNKWSKHKMATAQSACDKVQITSEQWKEIKSSWDRHQIDLVDLRAAAKKAILKYHAAIGSPETTLAEASSWAHQVATTKSEIINTDTSFNNDLVFQAFEPEKRKHAAHCLRWKRSEYWQQQNWD